MYDSKMYIHLTSLLSPLHFLPLKSTFILYVLGSIDFCKYLEEISEEINLPDSTNKNWQIKFPNRQFKCPRNIYIFVHSSILTQI